MSETDSTVSVPADAHAPKVTRTAEHSRKAPPPKRGGLGWLVAPLALAALGLSAFALWRVHAFERDRAQAQADALAPIAARVDELSRIAEQRKRDLESLRGRVGDADGVNRSLREELLSIAERSRTLEDAVANLAEDRLGARDALATNEAEFLLLQARERLQLFRDASAAITAYQLADAALAAAEDPVFASVRQTIAAELKALENARPMDARDALATLARVRGALAGLPPPALHQPDTQAEPSRIGRFLAQFVRVRHGQEAEAIENRSIGLTRALCALDLRAAEAALFARDEAAYKASLARARAGLAAGFDAQAPAVTSAIADLDRLAAAPFAPPLPELGSALRELRNLRATRSFAHPAHPAVAAPEAAPATAGEEGT